MSYFAAAAPAPLIATEAHAAFCYAAIERAFVASASAAAASGGGGAGGPAAPPPLPPPSFDGEALAPFFVSLSIGARLRGCLGSLSPRPLRELEDWACRSAFRDSRFAPLEAHELGPALSLSVSLLHSHEGIGRAAEDWELGLHGITLDFSNDRGERFRGTYLPYVAPAQSWTRAEAVRHLVRKAGFLGDAALVAASFSVTRFQASVVELSYAAYCAQRPPSPVL